MATILKVHFQFRFKSTVIASDVHGAWGLHIVTDDAMAGGDVPDPGGSFDPDSSWFWHKFFEWDRATLEYLTHEGETGTRRRLPSSKMTMAIIVDNDVTSDATLQFAYALRILFAWK